MNKIFKVVWNRTIQSFVVTSELAKGRVKSSAEQNSTDVSAESGKNGIATVFRLTVISAALFGASNAYAATAQVGRIEVDNTTSATAISGATATGVGALGVGLTAQANQGNAIAIGNSAQAQTGNTIAIGKSAVANSPASGSAPSSAIALGADANATGLGTIAIGRASEVLSQNSMNVNVTHNNIAIGNTARVGDSSSSKITQSIAIGSGNRVDKQGRPEGAWAKGDQSIAVGGNVVANGNSSVAIGGDDLDAVGGTRYSGNATDKFINYNEKGAKTGEYTLSGKSLRDIYKEMTGDTMYGGSYGNTIAGQGSVALGVQSNSSADLSLAIGTKSQATAFGGVALGTGAKATLLNSVALGTASKTDKEGQAYVQREIMGVTYTWAGGQTTDAGDVVSVGSKGYERQIINVSPGDISATSTDAINGSQLYGVLSAIERVRYFSVKSTDGSTDGTKNWNNDGAKGANSIAIGPSASTTSAATNGIAIGNQANVTGVNAVALGNGTTASVQDSVALGNGAVGAANNFDATAKNASFKNDSGAATNVSYAASSSSTIGAVSVGSAGNERQIQNVAAGRISATSTDAVNGSQLYTVMNNVGHNIQQNGTDKSRINNDGTVNYADGNLTTVAITDGENASKVQINVTQGTLSVDNNGTVSAPTAGVATAGDVANAINNAKTTTKVEAGSNAHVNKTTSGKETTYTVSADKATVQVSNALNLTSNTTTASDGAVTTNYSIDLAQNTKDDIQKGVDAKTTVDSKGLTFNGDSGSTNVEKLGSTVTVAGDDNITTEAQDDKVTVKLNKDLVVDSVKAGDTTVNNDGVKVGDDVALTQDGVKAGDVKLTKDGLNNAGNKVTNVVAGTDDTDAVNYGQLKETNANVAKGLNIAADNGNDDNVQLGETVAYRSSDKNIVTTVSDNQIDFKLAKDITVDSVTAGDSKLNSDGLTITGGPSVTKSGIDAAGNKITNVAPGTDDTDAVNYSQLKQQSAAARTEVAAGTNIKDVVKTTGANGQDIYTVNAKGTTASAGSDKVTVTASAEDANNVTDYSIDLAQDTKDDIQKGVDAKTTVDTKGLTFNGDSGSTNVEKLG
ncbi:TPA: ESPR-type extended signal peptide-containing protein, partial [Neisseria subflava]